MKLQEYSANIKALLDAEPYRTFKAKEIARRFGVDQQHYHELRAVLKEMVSEGIIFKYPHNKYGKGRGAQEAVGLLRVKTQGYGFVSREDGEDIFVSQRNMGLALHEDTVKVRLFARTTGKSQEGKIIEVLERSRQNIIGTYQRGRKFGFVVPDELKIQRDIFIHDADTMGAKPGQKVVTQITNWYDQRMNPEGRIVEVLGHPDDPGVDVLSVIRSYDLADAFPNPVEREVEKIPLKIPEKEIARRLDLREATLFTIDPWDAKDFDDAVSLEHLDNGNVRLGVHIADVSHFVAKTSALEKEAKARGTSVYLVDRVIPMLPERLSNEVCSLQEGKDRLAFSVLLELTPAADLIQYEFKESVIRSARRFTYNEVQDILDGKKQDPLKQLLVDMLRLSKSLIRMRQRRGSIDLDAPEVEVVLDDSGAPVDIHARQRLDSHRLIEEFMLLANETVAQHIGLVLRRQVEETLALPFVYRIHEKPDREKLQDFLAFAQAFGVDVHAPKRLTPRFFQKLINQVDGLDAEPIIRDAMLRAMMKARYSTENAGHFGLAYAHYTHFTSPIRRYPDLMVHRLLKRYMYAGIEGAVAATPINLLEKDCRLASAREIVAQEAERESIKMKKVEYMADRIGERYNGVISRVVSFGIFVELTDVLVEGLVHVTDLDDDYFEYDETRHAMIGQHHGQIYRVGDSLAVTVARVDIQQRIVDFILAEKPQRKRKKAKKRR